MTYVASYNFSSFYCPVIQLMKAVNSWCSPREPSFVIWVSSCGPKQRLPCNSRINTLSLKPWDAFKIFGPFLISCYLTHSSSLVCLGRRPTAPHCMCTVVHFGPRGCKKISIISDTMYLPCHSALHLEKETKQLLKILRVRICQYFLRFLGWKKPIVCREV